MAETCKGVNVMCCSEKCYAWSWASSSRWP